VYEPLWDKLYRQTKSNDGFSIRSIWIAEAVSVGASGVLNEGQLSNEYEQLRLICCGFQADNQGQTAG
jgi:hypothetical protein